MLFRVLLVIFLGSLRETWVTSTTTEEIDVQDGDIPGATLFLTPLIQSNLIQEARKKARVTGLHNEIISYSGLFTVNKEFNSNLFFWFFPSKLEPEEAPLVLWLNGGPGLSSVMTLFTENGPFMVDENQKLHLREHTWINRHSLLYIDSPAGTGFSFTDQEEGYARNQSHVAQDLYICLLQFFTMFPELRKNSFYVAGESYGGKYVPSLGEKIHTENQQASYKINVKGLMIGNGYSDPVSMMDHSSLLLELGYININSFETLREKENAVRKMILQENWNMASQMFKKILSTDYPSETGYLFQYNCLQTNPPNELFFHVPFVSSNNVRRMLHVENIQYDFISSKVYQCLHEDFVKSAKPAVETLLRNGYPILYYQGLLDMAVPYNGMMRFLYSLDWDGSQRFQSSGRQFWYVRDQLAAYVQEGQNLLFVGIRNAGHMVPYDKPELAELVINKFVAWASKDQIARQSFHHLIED